MQQVRPNRAASALDPPLAKRGLVFRPQVGAALVWWSRRPDGQIDPASQHTGCPVLHGGKVAVVNWMHFLPPKKVPLCVGSRSTRSCMPRLRDYRVCTRWDNRTCTVFTSDGNPVAGEQAAPSAAPSASGQTNGSAVAAKHRRRSVEQP